MPITSFLENFLVCTELEDKIGSEILDNDVILKRMEDKANKKIIFHSRESSNKVEYDKLEKLIEKNEIDIMDKDSNLQERVSDLSKQENHDCT